MNVYELSGIQKSFLSGGVTFDALRGVSVNIPEGVMIALQGPSGSGKSTLLNVLGLLEVPTNGEMKFIGERLAMADDEKLTELRRRSIGFIFQNFNLVPILSARENIEYPLLLDETMSGSASADRVTEVLHAVGLEAFGGQKPAQLSGGQRQRVAIARALVKRPKVILADEPTANLDSKNANQITELLKALQREYKSTIIIATHDQAVAEKCDSVLRLKDGELL